MGDGKSGLSHMPSSSSSSFPACPDDQATQVLENQEEEERGKGELRPEGGKRGHGESLRTEQATKSPVVQPPTQKHLPIVPPLLSPSLLPEKLKSPIPPFSGLDHRLVVSSFLLSLFPPLPTDGSRKERKNQEMNANSFERGWVKTSSVFI